MKKFLGSILITLSLALTSIVGAATAQAATCKATASGTEGPYYISGAPIRSNITESEKGIKTEITFSVVDTSCKAIKGATVDIWHANASGQYSGVDGNSGVYLRGSQVTNEKGRVTFTSIYPGWYPARTMHIHVKVWREGNEVLTTQFFASDGASAKIYAMPPYSSRGQARVNNSRDGIYQNYGSSVSGITLKVNSTAKKITATGRIVIN